MVKPGPLAGLFLYVDRPRAAWPMPLHACPRHRCPHQATLHRDPAREAEHRTIHRGELTEMRGGLTAEEYRWKLIKKGARVPQAIQ